VHPIPVSFHNITGKIPAHTGNSINVLMRYLGKYI
jgi:hypothetical protein